MAKNDKKLIEQLEERLDWYTREASDEEFDAEDVEAICTVLRKLSPEPEPFTTKEQAYQNLLERIAGEEEENKPAKEEETKAGQAEPEKVIKFRRAGRRKLKAAVFFGVIILAVWILSLNMVTYATARKSLFRVIMDGFREIEIRGNEDMMSEIKEDPNQFYDSWADLDSEIKGVIKVPGYIPEGFKLYSVEKVNDKSYTVIVADYYNERNGYLHFEITLWEGEIDDYYERYKMQDTWNLLEEYSNEQTIYCQRDEEYLSIFMIGDCIYRINSNTTLEELIKITENMS